VIVACCKYLRRDEDLTSHTSSIPEVWDTEKPKLSINCLFQPEQGSHFASMGRLEVGIMSFPRHGMAATELPDLGCDTARACPDCSMRSGSVFVPTSPLPTRSVVQIIHERISSFDRPNPTRESHDFPLQDKRNKTTCICTPDALQNPCLVLPCFTTR
jgi:hypothetical protein